MKLTIALRCFSLVCVALFASAIYRHSQRDLVLSVVLGIAAFGLSLVTADDRANTRELLLARAQPYLEPGETPQAVFVAIGGVGPYLGLIILFFIVVVASVVGAEAGAAATILVGLTVARWTVVATDRALFLLKSSMREGEGIAVTRLPRDTRLGPVTGRWAMIWLNGRWMFVHRRFHKQIELADRAITLPSLVVQPEPPPDWSRRRGRISLRLRNGSRRFRQLSLRRDKD